MAMTYRCDGCGAVSADPNGWFVVVTNFIHIDTSVPAGGRVQDATSPELLFDKAECRDAWCTQANISPPPPVVR